MIFYLILSVAFGAIQAIYQANNGDLCLPFGMPKYEHNGHYLECVEKFSGIGEWVQRECPRGSRFDPAAQECIQRNRMWSTAFDPPSRMSACPSASRRIGPGAICSRFLTPVSSCKNCGRSNYLACIPNSSSANIPQCGTWQLGTCPQGTRFNQQLLICVTQQGSCPSSNLVPIAPCTAQSQCPGISQCIKNTCCLIQTTTTDNRCTCCCSGTGQSNCPFGYQCTSNYCCPITSNTGTSLCPNGQQGIQNCKNTRQCPNSFICMNGRCCQTTGGTNNVFCPNGQIASSKCGGSRQSTCAAGQICTNAQDNFLESGCCPKAVGITCPNGQMPGSVCITTSGIPCPLGQSCINGACCQTTAGTTSLFCPNGQLASSYCVGTGQSTCAAGQICTNADDSLSGRVCCPMAVGVVCNNGRQPGSICIAASGIPCPIGQSCQNGACC